MVGNIFKPLAVALSSLLIEFKDEAENRQLITDNSSLVNDHVNSFTLPLFENVGVVCVKNELSDEKDTYELYWDPYLRVR
jgi:hypothetical protein